MNTQARLLIADDDHTSREFFYIMLSKLGFAVEQAANGKEALEKIETFAPDIILLDNVMPQISGWKLAKMLKSDERYKDISIIMLSGLDDVKDKLIGFELGVDDYIVKPFNFSEVLARIRVVLRNRDAACVFSGGGAKKHLADFLEQAEAIAAAAGRLGDAAKNGPLEEGWRDDLVKGIGGLGEKAARLRRGIADLDAKISGTKTGGAKFNGEHEEVETG